MLKKLNFTDPTDPESCSYNFFHYINNDQDVLKVAYMLVNCGSGQKRAHIGDPFWDDSSELLLVALMSYLLHYREYEDRSLKTVLKLLQKCYIREDQSSYINDLDILFGLVGNKNSDDFSYRTYKRFRIGSNRTLQSILITLAAKLAVFDTTEIRTLFETDTICMGDIGNKKTALFVVVSDTDRSMDPMVNLFFTQCMNELCRTADDMPDQKLLIDVRFFLDDFATHVRIEEFPRMIASIRSRGISTTLMIQAESQLKGAYGDDAQTIIGCCDTYVYMGGNDIDTIKAVAQSADLPLKSVLYMPVGTNWIFRRGQPPVKSKNFELEPFLEKKKINLHQYDYESYKVTDQLQEKTDEKEL